MNKEDIKNYVEGNINYFKDKLELLSTEFKDKILERQKICEFCEFLDKKKSICTKCGCDFPALSFAKSKHCPINKWNKIEDL